MRSVAANTITMILINVAITVCLILALGIAGEIYLRRYVPQKDYRGLYERKSDPRQYAMKPQADMVGQGVRVTTNSDGFRDTEFKDAAGKSRFVIAVLGDSFTFGQGVKQDDVYPALLEKQLNQSVKSDFFRVWNLGVSGYNTEQEAFVFESFVLPRAPKWVVVGYNINDYEAVDLTPENASVNEGGHPQQPSWFEEITEERLLAIQFIKHRIGSLIRIFRPQWYGSSYVEDILAEYLGPGPGWQRVSGLLTKMNDECKANGIGFSVAVLPAMLNLSQYPFESVHDVVVSYCRSSAIDCVDVLPYFRSKNLEDTSVSLIDAHPNAAAQQIFADAIEDHLLAQKSFSRVMEEFEKKGGLE